MWRNTYKDYQLDGDWLHERVEPVKGIIGCEMHELNGWGDTQHISRPRKKGWIRKLFAALFRREGSN